MSFAARVHGLPASASEEAVRDFFSRIGPVEQVTLTATAGEAIVAFDNADDLEEALHVSGREFEDGTPITVTRAAGEAPTTNAAAETTDAKEAHPSAEVTHDGGATANEATADAADAPAEGTEGELVPGEDCHAPGHPRHNGSADPRLLRRCW